MNLFIRYFDHEALAHNIDEALAFLNSIGEITVDESVEKRILQFMNAEEAGYPYRLKVSYSNYVLFLHTEADTLEEFHEWEKTNRENRGENRGMTQAEKKRMQIEALSAVNPGWYEGSVTFKRVTTDPETNKCKYVDTTFVARCKASSPADCYNRIIDHLKEREDVDPRCQFPSIRSSNFSFTFLQA